MAARLDKAYPEDTQVHRFTCPRCARSRCPDVMNPRSAIDLLDANRRYEVIPSKPPLGVSCHELGHSAEIRFMSGGQPRLTFAAPGKGGCGWLSPATETGCVFPRGLRALPDYLCGVSA